MKRFAIAILFAAACSGKNKADTTTPEPDPDRAKIYAKKIIVSFGIAARGSAADVFLQLTDETGKQTSYPLGNYDGPCETITPAPEMRAVTGVRCKPGGVGTELHAVIYGSEIVVLRLRTDEGVTPDPMAREEIQRLRAPGGAAIEAG
jgi:hypothetical protein